MSRWEKLSVIAIVLSSSLGLQARQATPPVYTSGTNFVQVPVIVQKSGKHVSGLNKGDFSLRQDGKEQPIATFEEIRGGAQSARSEAQSVNQNATEAAVIPSQLTIIALDTVDTPSPDRTYFNQQFEKYLAKDSTLSSPISLVAIERSGIRVLRDFTTNQQSLLTPFAKDATAQPSAHNEVTQT